MRAGINLEFTRSAKMTTEEGMRAARQAGYRFVEPYAYTGMKLPLNSHLEIRSFSDFHHIDTGRDHPGRLLGTMDEVGLRFSAVDVHSTLLMPQIGVPYLLKAINFAAATKCPIVMSDEGPVPTWLPQDQAFDIMCVSLDAVIPYARQNGVMMAIELHNSLTTSKMSLQKLLERYAPNELGVNFDTGNSFLAGNDPLELLDSIADRVVHVHAKDIPESQLGDRGKVTGTRVGVAVGDGVIDFSGIITRLKQAGFQGICSVECDTLEQAVRSLPRLNRLIGKT